MGIKVTVNSDDPPLFNTTLSAEYTVLATEFGYDLAGLTRIARNAFEVSGAPTALKQQLLAEFDLWAGNKPGPR
jgi:aminodeoxyfutalosine deaminase